ncbi:hypothetical protein KR054_001233, partial [Drosophila jambulina]
KCEHITTKIGDGAAYWKYKKRSYTRTEDLFCLKYEEEILILTCNNSTGQIPDKIGCKQKLIKMQCPDNLYEIQLPDNGIHCTKISSTSQGYNENFCYGSNKIIPIDLTKSDIVILLQFLIKRNISENWLPIRKVNESVNESDKHYLKHAFFKKNVVCVFNYDFPISKRYPQRFGALIFGPNKCFFKDWWTLDNCVIKYLTKRNLFKNVLYKYVLNDENKKDFVIIYSHDNFDNQCIILLNTYNMMYGFNKSLHEFLSLSKTIIGLKNSIEVIINLKMKERGKLLTLIYNRKYLFFNNEDDIGVQCFTYKAYGILRKVKIAIIWENEDQSHSSPCCCEGHIFIHFQFVTTRKFVVFSFFGYDFVIRWKILCIQTNKNVFHSNLLCEAFLNNLTHLTTKNVSSILFDIHNLKLLILEPEKKFKKVISEKNNDLLTADIHIIPNIIGIHFKRLSLLSSQISKINTGTSKWKNAVCTVINVYNSLTNIKTKVLRMSAKLNLTNKLLESFEQSIDSLSILSLSNESMSGGKEYDFLFDNDIIDYQDIGVSVKVSKNLLYFLINPVIANVSGIALFSKTFSGMQSQKSLIKENYRFLQSNHETRDFLNEPNLQLGVYLPEDLLNRLKFSSDSSKSHYKSVPLIIIKVYSNDKLFQQKYRKKIICSRIISISIPRYSKNLPIPIPLIIRKCEGHKLRRSDSCHYWNYGNWASNGITIMNTSEENKDIVMCSIKHLSHFAYLVEHKPS